MSTNFSAVSAAEASGIGVWPINNSQGCANGRIRCVANNRIALGSRDATANVANRDEGLSAEALADLQRCQ
jgi:hypothetical protein